MSDANEERLLSDLLRDIADADARVDAPDDLEPRVMERYDARSAIGDRPSAIGHRPSARGARSELRQPSCWRS